MAVIGTLGCILFFAHVTGLRNLLAGLATLLVLAVVIKRRHLPEAFRPVIPWLAISLVSASWSVAPGQSLGDALTSALLPVGCGLATYIWMKREDVERLVVYPVLLGLVLVLAFHFVYLGSSPSPWVEKLYSYWPGRGVMSTLCILILPLGAWLIVTGRRALGIALVGLALLAGSQNLNRMFWLAALAVLLPCLFMAQIGRYARIALLALGVLGAGGGVLYAQSQHYSELSAVGAVQSDVRWQVWKSWLELANERPWLGYGYGMRAVELVGKEANLPETLGQGRGHPHNILLGQLIQIGGLGLLFFLAAQGSLIWRFARQIRKPENRAAAVGGIALIVGLLAKNMTDDFFNYSGATMFWIQLGVFLRLAGVGDESS